MLCWGEVGSQTRHNPTSETLDVLQGQRIQHVCSRDAVTVFVLRNGKVYTSVRGRKKQKAAGLFPHFKEQKIHFVDSETSHILFLSKAGTIYQSEVKLKETATNAEEFSITKPQVLKSLCQRNIIQVACGNNHTMALCKDGELFAWGQNTHGQLGLGTQEASQSVPQCVISLTGMPVAQITAGGEHSFALSLSGAVFGWGRNNRGQLGLKDTKDRYEPNYVKLLECKKTIHISCGEEHTAVLTKDGFVYTFGAGSHGQLGHNSTKDEIKPHFVGYLFGNKVSQIACGSYHTLAFVPSSGKIYSFGRGEKGQLGSGDTSDRLVPLPVNIITTCDINETEDGHRTKHAVRRIFAGGNQSFAEYGDEVEWVTSVDSSSCNTLRSIMIVDNLLEKKLDKKTRKDIVRAFSTPQSLSGSFLDVSKDSHFETNEEMSGLDMSAVYLGFVELAKNSLMLEQVKNAVQNSLIPSLPRSPACVETMRVYIILPELIAVLEDPRDSAMLTDSLNKAILSLRQQSFKILECWWSTMPYYFFLRLVRMYRKASKQLLQETMADTSKGNSKLHDSLKILQALYKANLRRLDKIRERNFCIPVMKIFKNSLLALVKLFPVNPQMIMNKIMNGYFIPEFHVFQYFSALRQIQQQLIPYPCIFDFETKLEALNLESKIIQHTPQLVLQVRRKMILQDALYGLRSIRSAGQFAALQVQFIGEVCVGHGVSQEFFTLFSQELYENEQIFHCHEDSKLLWFPKEEPEVDDVFYLVGILCGLAVSNGFICNFRFPLALYKKLLHEQPTLEDLKELSRVGEGLQNFLDSKYDDPEELCFSVCEETADGEEVVHEFIPNGSNIPVQNHNRKQYVDAYVDYKLNVSVKNQFEAFSAGFRSHLSVPIVDVFHAEELRHVIQGNTNYEWEQLEQNTVYDGYAETDTAVRNFWEVFESLSEKKKKQFLTFLSGSERVPAGGIRNFDLKILNTRSEDPDLSYPRAYTCTRTLDLPNYSNIEILRERLLHAIKYSEEFNAVPP